MMNVPSRSIVVVMTAVLLLCAGSVLAGEVRVVVTFNESDLFISRSDRFDVIDLMPCGRTNEVGKPQLPAMYTDVAIPAGTRLVEIGTASVVMDGLPGTYLIKPVQKPIPTSEYESSVSWVDPDPAVYSSSAPYPDEIVSVLGEADLAGQNLVSIRIHPLRYVGVTGKLSFIRSLEVVVRYRETDEEVVIPRLSAQARRSYERMVKDMVINPEDVALPVPTGDPVHWSIPADTVDYVLLTESIFEPYFQELIDWHTKRGIKAKIVIKDSINAWYGGTSGSNADSVRQFVKDAHNEWGAIYFLMGGSMGRVPVKYKNFGSPGSRYSDTYYADYDDDWRCEVNVGRIPVDQTSQAETYVEKALFYMKTPPTSDYPEKIILTGFDLDSQTHCEELMRYFVDHYIPEECVICSVYDSHYGNHKYVTRDSLNSGQHIWGHADHGYTNLVGLGDYWHGLYFDNSDVDRLTNNNELTHFYSPACLPGNYAGDSWCEHWCQLNPLQAGISFIGNTGDGYYESGTCFTLSGRYQWNWGYSLWGANYRRLGLLFSDHKNRTYPSEPYMQSIFYELSLIGDPAIDIWHCHDLTSMDVSYPAYIPQGTQDFTVTVEDGGSPIQNALVCAMKGDEVYERGLTGSDGTITLTIAPGSEGTMDVTVTHVDYLPFEGTCSVGEPPDVTVTLYPDGTEVERGGLLGYTVEVTNYTAEDQTFDYWSDAYLWTGEPYKKNPIFGPFQVTVKAGMTKSGHLSHKIPNNAPLRTYTLYGRIGTHPGTIWDEDYFEFTVVEPTGGFAVEGKPWQVIECSF